MIGVKAGYVGVCNTILFKFEMFNYEKVLKLQHFLQKSVPLPSTPKHPVYISVTALHPKRHTRVTLYIFCVPPSP